MKKYNITLKMMIEAGFEFEVEAESIEHAKAKVFTQAQRGNLTSYDVVARAYNENGIHFFNRMDDLTEYHLAEAVCAECNESHHGECGEEQCDTCKGEGMNSMVYCDCHYGNRLEKSYESMGY